MDYKIEIAKKLNEITNIDVNELASFLEIPPDTTLGDYAFPCFKLAKELKKAPPMIANEIKEGDKVEVFYDKRIPGLNIRPKKELADVPTQNSTVAKQNNNNNGNN